MKVLIIVYDFYPENKPNAYRWFNIAKKWQKEGKEVFVLTANKNQYLDFEEVDGIKIFRTTEYLVGNIKYKYRDDVKTTIKLKEGIPSKVKSLGRKVARGIYNFTWSKLYWPDYSFLWYFSSKFTAFKILEENRIEKVITVSWTFTSHLIGRDIKKKYPNIIWLADTIDVFSFNSKVNNLFLYNKLNNVFEKKVFLEANWNTVLTENIRKKYEKMFPDVANKISVVNNVYIPVDFDFNKEVINKKSIKLLFLGTLAEEVRSPKRMLLVFDKLIRKYSSYNFILNFYGDFRDTVDSFNEYSHLLNKSIFLNDLITREEVNLAIKDADVLLNIGNKNEYQEPSKLIEYIYSGKKILNFCSIAADTSLGLLEKYPLKYNVFSSSECNEELLSNIFQFLNSDETIDKVLVKEILKKYLLEEVADRYLQILENNTI